MSRPENPEMPSFRPLVVNALYTGIRRGLAADLVAAHLLSGTAHPVCTAHVVASHGVVTDVLEVPTDTVAAQLEHLFDVLPPEERPNAAKVSIVNHAATIEAVAGILNDRLDGPYLLDLTLSGPSGEDIIDARSLEILKDRLEAPTLVSLRARDAKLVAQMELESLDDAQVAVQRIHKLGARRVLLRCGTLPQRHFEAGSTSSTFAADLLYEGEKDEQSDEEAFALYEAPRLQHAGHGASSVFTLAILSFLHQDLPLREAVQRAKGYVSERLRGREATLAPPEPASHAL